MTFCRNAQHLQSQPNPHHSLADPCIPKPHDTSETKEDEDGCTQAPARSSFLDLSLNVLMHILRVGRM